MILSTIVERKNHIYFFKAEIKFLNQLERLRYLQITWTLEYSAAALKVKKDEMTVV